MSMIWKHTLVFKFLLSNNFGEEMKLIIAIIQPEELPDIKEELIRRKIYKFTVTNAKGQGREIPVQEVYRGCLLYTSPSPRDGLLSRMPSSA